MHPRGRTFVHQSLTCAQATTASTHQQQQHSSPADLPANGSVQVKPRGKGKGKRGRGGAGGGDGPAAGASSVSSGVKLEDVCITFKNQQVLRGVSWDVKTGERVGLVGAPPRIRLRAALPLHWTPCGSASVDR